MSTQKLSPPPEKKPLCAVTSFRQPALAGDADALKRLNKARIRGLIDGQRTNEFPSNPWLFFERPCAIKEHDWMEAGIPRHLFSMSRHFKNAFINGRKVFTVYYNQETNALDCAAHDTPEEAFDDAVLKAAHKKKLILSLSTTLHFAEQLHGKNGPYISPIHCLDHPIITKGTLRERETEFVDPRPPEYWYR